MDKAAVTALKKICPDRCSTDKESLVLYGYDATGISGKPDAVVFPITADEVAGIVRVAAAYKLPLVPRGAGTGLTGGSVPVKGGIVLSMEKMNRILSVSKADLTAEVEPGVVTGTLKKTLEDQGLFYPPDPASSEFSSIGGNRFVVISYGVMGFCCRMLWMRIMRL